MWMLFMWNLSKQVKTCALLGWLCAFMLLVCRCELRYVQASKFISGVHASVWTVGPRLIYLAVVVPPALLGVVIRPERLYVCLALLFNLTHSFLGCFFLAISRASESMISLRRIKVRVDCFELREVQIIDG